MSQVSEYRMGAGDSSRIAINTNKGIRNIVVKENMVEEITTVLKDILTIMTPHCGPNSRYAMLITGAGGSDFEPNIFTKDGIQILSYVEYASPIQAYVRNALKYIGSRVEKIAKDGTTTAIIFTAHYLLRAISDERLMGPALTTVEKEVAYQELSKLISDALSKVTLTFDDITKSDSVRDRTNAAGTVAYMQAMSSSGGNNMLSGVVRETFSSTTEASWPYLRLRQSVVETEDTFRVITRDCDYRIACQLEQNNLLNADLDRKYIAEDVNIFAYPEEIENGLSINDSVIGLINTSIDKPLAIIARRVSPLVVNAAKKRNDEGLPEVSIFVSQNRSKASGSDWDILGILASAGVDPFTNRSGPIDPEDLVTATKIEWGGNTLDISGIIKEPLEGGLHPYLVDPNKCEGYTFYLKALNNLLDRAKHGHVDNEQEIHKASDVLLQLTTPRAPLVQVCGTTHENLANVSVMTDAMGATIASLESGFVVNGVGTILTVLMQLRESLLTSVSSDFTTWQIAVLDAMLNGFGEIYQILYGTERNPKDDLLDLDKYKYANCRNFIDSDNTFITHDINDFIATYEEGISTVDEDYPVLQPVVLYTELFNRVGELVVRMLSTDKFVVPGGAYVD